MTITFNWRQMFKTLGILLITESFMLVAAGVAAIYGEYDLKYLLIVRRLLWCVAVVLLLNKNADCNVGIREGYTIVGLVWIIFSFSNVTVLAQRCNPFR